ARGADRRSRRDRGHPERAVGRALPGDAPRAGSRRAARGHLPRLRTCVPDGRRAGRRGVAGRAPHHDARARQQPEEGRPSRAIRGKDRLGRRADVDAEDWLRRHVSDGTAEYGGTRDSARTGAPRAGTFGETTVVLTESPQISGTTAATGRVARPKVTT